MVRDTGFEPVTPSVSGRCSTTELTALKSSFRLETDRQSKMFLTARQLLYDGYQGIFWRASLNNTARLSSEYPQRTSPPVPA